MQCKYSQAAYLNTNMKANATNVMETSSPHSSSILTTDEEPIDKVSSSTSLTLEQSTSISIEPVVVCNDEEETVVQHQTSHYIRNMQDIACTFLKNQFVKNNLIKVIGILLFHVYVGVASYHQYINGKTLQYCEGFGFLLIIVALVYIYI